MEDAAPKEKIQGTGDNRLCFTTENRSTSWIPHHNLNTTLTTDILLMHHSDGMKTRVLNAISGGNWWQDTTTECKGSQNIHGV